MQHKRLQGLCTKSVVVCMQRVVSS